MGHKVEVGRTGPRSLLTQRQLTVLWVTLSLGFLMAAVPAVRRQAGWVSQQVVDAEPKPAGRRLEFPWETLLTAEEQRRGISYWGSGAAMHRVASKLLAGEPIKAYSLGGSVTGGGGSSRPNKTGYVAMFHKFIRHNFPHEGHDLQNKAIAASTAFMYAACLQHHVPEDADLVTLEFTVNEKGDAPYPSPERRSFEQLLRRLVKRKKQPAVLVLHHYGWWNSPGDGIDRGLFYVQPELQLTAFSHYYDLPALSVRSAAWHLMNAGVNKFKVHRVFLPNTGHLFVTPDGQLKPGTVPTGGPKLKSSLYFVDATHPANPGHQVLAELLSAALSRAVWDATTGCALTAEERRHDPAVPAVPPPMIPFNADDVPGMCAMLEEFKPVVKQQQGFEYAAERPAAETFMKQKWGWRATEPGSWAELEVDTRASDGSLASDTVVWLSHLQSYEGMGTARVECVSGCSCNPTRLDGTWERHASLFTIHRFHVTRHRQCRIRVTVLEKPGEVPQEGHKCVLVAVMVTHVPLDPHHGGGGSLALVQNIGLSHDSGF